MSDRERIRRPEPVRTHPVRNLAAAFRNGDSTATAGSSGSTGSTGSSGDGTDPAASSFGWSGDDPVSRAVRAGCDVVEKAVRRGFGLGGDPRSGLWPMPWVGAWAGGSPPGPWTTGQWVDAMTSAYTQWLQWIDAWSSMAYTVGGGGEPTAGGWGPAPSTPAPSAPRSAGALRVTVELRCARAVSVQLDLPPGASGPLEIYGLLAAPAAGAPPITDVTIAVVDGGAVIAVGSIDKHPAATYVGTVLGAGRPCGTLTVRLT